MRDQFKYGRKALKTSSKDDLEEMNAPCIKTIGVIVDIG
jgi:hypothetical protein